jgi:hypothetical protein
LLQRAKVDNVCASLERIRSHIDDTLRMVRNPTKRCEPSGLDTSSTANKYFKYQNGRSRIIYIDTTKTGAERPAASAVNKASQAFGKLHGVKTIEVHIATCRPRRNLQTWKHLETALLDTFVNRYFQLPKYNKIRPKPKKELFRYTPLAKLISQFDRG